MKITLQSISLLFVGLLLVSSCSEEKTGESLKQIADKLDLNPDDEMEDTTSYDSIELEIIEPVPSPPPPVPPLPPSRPEPEPWPPEPIPYPEPLPLPPPPPEPNPIIDFPDIEPKYPEGEKEMVEFIMNTIQYPQIDLEMGNEGRVFLEFVVEKDGSLTNIKVLRGVTALMDKEAKRIIELMPNWTPGKSGGKIVRTKMRLPISFRLD